MQFIEKVIDKENLEYLVLIANTFAVVTLIAYLIRKVLTYFINKNSAIIKTNPTNFVFLKNSISFILYTVAVFWIFHKIPYFKNLGTALFASAGIFAAMIGFASQKAFSNIIGGVFILMFKPFRIGDTIELQSTKKGVVEEITLRHTIIRDYEFRRVVIPNSIIGEETITNSSIKDEKIRKHIEFNIAYNSDIDLATNIIKQVIEEHPFCIDNRTPEEIKINEEKVMVRLVKLGEYSMTLKAYVWCSNNDDAFELYCYALKAVKEQFEKNNIEIPLPYQNIILKK